MAPNTQHKRLESHEMVGATDASPVSHSNQSTAGGGTRPTQHTTAHNQQGEGGGFRGRGSNRSSSHRGRGGLGHGGPQRRGQPPSSLMNVNVVNGHQPASFFPFNQPQMPMPPPEFNPSMSYALPMMPVGGGAPPPGMMMHGKPIEENGPPLNLPVLHPQPFIPAPPPPPHYSPLHFTQPPIRNFSFMPHPPNVPLFIPPLPQQPVPPPHLLQEQPRPMRASRGRLLFSPPSAESSAQQRQEPKVVQPLARAKNILFTLDSETGRAMERPKEERVVEQLMVIEPRDRPSSIEPCRPSPSSSPAPPSASTAVAEPVPPPSTASRHSPPPGSPKPDETANEEDETVNEEEDSASEGELGEMDIYLQSVYEIIEQTKPNMAEKAYNDEFLIAMRDIIRKESGWTGVGPISTPSGSSLPLPVRSTLPAPRLPPSVSVVEKAARPWTNHPVQPLPGAIAAHRPGGPVAGPLNFSRNAMRVRKEAKAVERSENAFAPKREVTEPVPVDEKLIKGIRRILNKITPTTYEEMATDFCAKEFHLESEDFLAAVVDLIFEKAIDEPMYCQLYADLCKRQSDEEKSAKDNGRFLQAVIRKCQVTFERDVQHIEEGVPTSETVEEASGVEETAEETRAREKKRILGTIKLIACLYQHSCIGAIVMAMCANILFHHYRDENDELYIEYAVEMFQEVGPKFRKETTAVIKRGGSAQEVQRAKEVLKQWDSTYNNILRARSDLSPRVRILVTNLDEGIRKAANVPKKMEELEREAREETHQQERKRMEFNERRHAVRYGNGPNVRFPPSVAAAQRPLVNNPARSPPRPSSPVRQASPVRSPAEQQRHREEEMRERRMRAGLASTKAGGGGNAGACVTQGISLIQTNKSTSVSLGGARPSPFGRKFPPCTTKTTEELTSINWRQRDTMGDSGGGNHQVPVKDKAAKEHGE